MRSKGGWWLYLLSERLLPTKFKWIQTQFFGLLATLHHLSWQQIIGISSPLLDLVDNMRNIVLFAYKIIFFGRVVPSSEKNNGITLVFIVYFFIDLIKVCSRIWKRLVQRAFTYMDRAVLLNVHLRKLRILASVLMLIALVLMGVLANVGAYYWGTCGWLLVVYSIQAISHILFELLFD